MKVVIPMAGWGSRMRPQTWSKPKPLLNVAGKPVLGHVIDMLHDIQIDGIVYIYGFLGEQVEKYVQEHYNYPHHFVEQKELKGQAHALWLAREYLKGAILSIFVDTIIQADFSGLEKEAADVVAYVKEIDDPRRFGVAVLNDQDCVTRFIEKPTSIDNKLVVVGVYYIRDGEWLIRAIEELMAKNIQTKGEFFLTDALTVMIDQGAKVITRKATVWEDCGKPAELLQTNRFLLEHGSDNSAQAKTTHSAIVPPCNIAPDCTIENSVIGPYAVVASGATVRNAIVRDSIIDRHASVEDAMLDQSLIGEKAIIRGHFQMLNVGDSSQVNPGEYK